MVMVCDFCSHGHTSIGAYLPGGLHRLRCSEHGGRRFSKGAGLSPTMQLTRQEGTFKSSGRRPRRSLELAGGRRRRRGARRRRSAEPEVQGKSHLRQGACLPAERLAGLEGSRRRAPTVDAAAGEAARPVRDRVPQRAPRTGTSSRSHWSHFLSGARAAARPQTVLRSTASVICAVAAEKSQRRPSLRA